MTESQGRVHTSAAGVLVLPEAEPVDVQIEDNDLRIDVFRSSGPGGQSVNTTDSAVRITHLPTGIVVSCQNEKSQLQNREQAMRILRARLLAAAEEEASAEASDARRSQVRTVDRSERIRTYNYPENRISDHRTGYKSYDLDRVLDGDLEAVIASCVEADMAARLEAIGDVTGPSPTRALLRGGHARLAEAGVASPEYDAAELLAHVLGTTRGRLPLVDDVPTPTAAPLRRRCVAPARRPRAAPAPDRHDRRSATSSSRSGPGSSCPRPETELLAGWAVERAREAGERPVVVDLCTGSGAIALSVAARGARPRGCTPSSWTRPRTPGPSATSPAPGSTCVSATWPTPSPSSTAPSTWWSATRRTSRSRPSRPSPPRRATTTRRWRSGRATTGSTRCACSRRPPPGCCGPAAGWAPSTPTCRASRRPRCSPTPVGGREVRDHRDLAGRARYVTARLAR